PLQGKAPRVGIGRLSARRRAPPTPASCAASRPAQRTASADQAKVVVSPSPVHFNRRGPRLRRGAAADVRAARAVPARRPGTCPERADTSDVGVSPRGGSPNGEAGGGERGTPTAAPVVHAGIQA